MPFVEEPAHLSKSRLKSDLVAHNVALPPAASKKAVYVELHLKHIDQKNAADFSSDEEDRAGDDKKDPEDAEMPVPSCLTDEDLKATLRKHGVKPGPITASTRVLYERKLHKLLQSDRCERLNKADKVILYSDSEEEEKQQEKDEDLGSEKQPDPSDQTQQESSQPPQEPVKDAFKDILPDSKTTPTGIYVTRRRPIKGAAQRPVQYSYPDSPVSPMTQQRREVERYLVPIHIQILVFIIVACVLYLIYVGVEDSLSYWSYGKDRLLVQAESQDADVDYAQD
ncbi:LEM domain-containing protein 1 isoform X2 [Neolamprologus brichardi]|uniref:LEM domain-containing protein 1 isoform X2 n=1 Tax=Neolamprologus brichardi TaxID=32507 RepID=UPI0003EBE43C|nr:LEM domain-containing protein 1 isoform X2 [Neolamprologus brichardi]